MARKPYTWARKPTRTRRTARALKDSARDRAEILRRRAVMKLKGHKHICRECGKTTRTDNGRDAHRLHHQRERQQTRTKGGKQAAPRVPFKGREQFWVGGKRYRNLLDWKDAERQRVEREDDTKRRAAERARRAKAVNDRNTRGGKPNGAPKTRTPRARDGRTAEQRKAEWKAHRMQHAAGRMDRAGNRLPNTGPSPRVARVVQPKTPRAPKVRT